MEREMKGYHVVSLQGFECSFTLAFGFFGGSHFNIHQEQELQSVESTCLNGDVAGRGSFQPLFLRSLRMDGGVRSLEAAEESVGDGKRRD